MISFIINFSKDIYNIKLYNIDFIYLHTNYNNVKRKLSFWYIKPRTLK